VFFKSTAQPFRPAWWCPGAHAQTIFARFFRPVPRLALSRQRLETPDHDFLDVDILEGKQTAPLAIILHGLEGSSQAPYVQSLLGQMWEKGWQAAAVNFRSCSGELNRLKKTYHSGQTDDLDFILDHFRKNKVFEKIVLVGFSIGGNIVLKWLGEQAAQAAHQIHKAVAISVPYDLAQSAQLMDQGFNREVYTRKLLSTLKPKALAKEKQFPGILDPLKVKRCKTFRVFDSEVTAPVNGFRDALDYWTQSSSARYLKQICVPVLLIHAEDDPFFPGKYLPYEQIRSSDYLHALVAPRGGHLGFVAGPWPWKQELWLEKRVMNFLSEGPGAIS